MAARSPASMNLRPASLVTWMPSGALAAMRRAISMARSTCWPAGVTSCTRPMRKASSAPNSSHSIRWYIALPQPARVMKRKWAPPSGAMPRLASIWQKRLPSAATTMSPASAISMPTVKQMPWTAVTTGLRH